MQLEIVRLEMSIEHGTFGVLLLNKKCLCLTVELPWIANEPYLSCIPMGKYIATRHQSPKFGETFQVMNVPNRSHIIFHAGNTVEDTQGCIILGSKFGDYDGIDFVNKRRALLESTRAFRDFMKRVQGHDELTLETYNSWAD